ncbi:hypothetical protein HYDPIDRAFT_24794 [Hydnomerulius pinastri MD-312]|nr:hypothetical protein HYDPIDRAFT_24794 [Hydnomerulius pinastri MD-312]
MPVRVIVAKSRGSYPRPLTADSSADFPHFSSSQLAHEEEAYAQKCEISKDDIEIEKKERKRDEDDDDFYLGSQELYNQSSSQSTESDSDTTEIPRRANRDDEDGDSEWDMDAEESLEYSQSSQSSAASVDDRTPAEILRNDKGISREKIKLIYKAIYGNPLEVNSPDRKRLARKLVAILYGLDEEEMDTVDRWIRRNKGQLGSWPFEA